jgi:catechol 2,3-dioxygenase
MIESRTELEPKSIIHPNTRLGHVHLTVSDLGRSLAFYQGALGFQIHREEGDTAFLGAGRDDLLVLTERPEAIRVPRRSGLYHYAILVPSRLALAGSLKNLIEIGMHQVGGADHLVSEALYLEDPDGNGIEIYRDRSRSEWQYDNGVLRMATDPLDYSGILAELNGSPAGWMGLHPDTVLGHMHLHVSHLAQATKFYEKVLGFGLVASVGETASFLSAGGYHHHLAVNTWNGVGVPPPPPDSVGLRYFVIQLPSQEEKARLVARLETARVPLETRQEGLFLRDPSQNGLLFTAADTNSK